MSEDTVKAALVRRCNALFAALREVEWSAGDSMFPYCPACGGDKRTGHQDVDGGSIGRDAVTQQCPIEFALSEEASAELTDGMIVTRTFDDGSRFLRRVQFDVTGSAIQEGP